MRLKGYTYQDETNRTVAINKSENTASIIINTGLESPKTWDCNVCGTSGITSKFCPECGNKKPDEAWTCPSCGLENIKSKFCPNCGEKRK